jgi:hypothetical protein
MTGSSAKFFAAVAELSPYFIVWRNYVVSCHSLLIMSKVLILGDISHLDNRRRWARMSLDVDGVHCSI